MQSFNKRAFSDIFIAFLLLVITMVIIDLVSYTDIGDDLLGRLFFSTGYRRIGSMEICPAIEKVDTPSDHTKLVIGDSVCHQIFNVFQDQNDDYLLLGTNQAITMDGQYILAKLFLNSHTEVSDIYLVLLPGGFASGCDSEMSYSYLVEPFGRMNKLNLLSEYSQNMMTDIYGNIFLQKRVIELIDDSCINNKIFLFNNQKRIEKMSAGESSVLSKEAEYYVMDLYEICRSRNISLHILPGPIMDTESRYCAVENLQDAVEKSAVAFLFENYFESISYYPEEMFPDGVHFGGGYDNEEIYRQCLKNLQEKSGSLDGLMY